MTGNNLDDIFKKRLESHESIVPVDMWHRISSGKIRKKPLFWWFAFIVMFIALIIYTRPLVIKKAGVALTGNKRSSETQSTPDNRKIDPLNPGKRFNKVHRLTTSVSVHNYPSKTRARYQQQSISTLKIGSNLTSNTRIIKDTTGSTLKIDNLPLTNAMMREPATTDTSSKSTEQAISTALENKEQKDKWFIEAFVSPVAPFNRFRSGNPVYQTTLNKSLSTTLSFNYGINIGYQVSNHFYAKTGIQLMQVNERYSFRNTVTNGTSTMKNTYTFVGVPLLATLNKDVFPRLQASVTTGIVVNIATHNKGFLPTPLGGSANISTEGIYDNNVRADFYLSVGLLKPLDNNFRFYIEPYLRYQLKNMTTQFQTFDHKITAIGLSAGIRYDLFKGGSR